MKPQKTLQDLTLLDRFLFAEAMEDPEIIRTLLEIILGEEVVLKYLPQVEKEERSTPLYRYIKLDVWTQDIENTVYDTEVQNKNTGNIPKRSRYYQGMIDGKMLKPGEIDFNSLNNVFIIIISPFDLFGYGKYKYTFKMKCEEKPDIDLDDGAVRIFLNTRGTNADAVSAELVELLTYMENTGTVRECKSERIKKMQKKVERIKSSEEVSVRYMQEWEERELDRQEALKEGENKKIKELIAKKLTKGKSVEVIADELEETTDVIERLIRENFRA